MTDPTDPPRDRSHPAIPPELDRYGPWGAVPAAGAPPDRRPRRVARGRGGRRSRTVPGQQTARYEPLVRRRRSLRWSATATTAAALAGAIGATTTAPLALSASSPSVSAGWWVATAAGTAVGGAGAALRLRIAAHGPDGSRRRALEDEIWARHTRSVPGGVVVDAPGQQRWRFSQALGEVERRVAGLPAAERALLLAEARTVAVGASRLLLDAGALGQARLVVFPDARFGRLDLTPDDSVVPGAGAAYRRLLDDAERQLEELAAALTDLSRSQLEGSSIPAAEIHRLHTLVSLAELDDDPTTRGPAPAIVAAAERLRAQAAAHRELDGG